MKTRGFWPTAPRDAIVISYAFPLDKPRSFLNVTTSVPSHPLYVARSGDVRMLAHLAGAMVEPHPQDEGCSLVTQIVDGDLMGWLPKSVVAMISTQAFPVSMKKYVEFSRIFWFFVRPMYFFLSTHTTEPTSFLKKIRLEVVNPKWFKGL